MCWHRPQRRSEVTKAPNYSFTSMGSLLTIRHRRAHFTSVPRRRSTTNDSTGLDRFTWRVRAVESGPVTDLTCLPTDARRSERRMKHRVGTPEILSLKVAPSSFTNQVENRRSWMKQPTDNASCPTQCRRGPLDWRRTRDSAMGPSDADLSGLVRKLRTPKKI
jgi:hypothetical protein